MTSKRSNLTTILGLLFSLAVGLAASTAALSSRAPSNYHLFLHCANERLPNGPYGVSTSSTIKWSRMNFTGQGVPEMQFMCSTFGHPRGNFGGRCYSTRNGDGTWHRHATFDFQLAVNVGLFEVRLLQMCIANCRCPLSDEEIQASLNRAIAGLGLREPDGLVEEEREPVVAFARIGNVVGQRPPAGESTNIVPIRRCATRCENLRCPPSSSSGRDDCRCRAVRLAKNTFAPGGCAAQARAFWPGGGKRSMEVEDACPCNATYVSQSCCLAKDDGLVWERPGLKLGVIDSTLL